MKKLSFIEMHGCFALNIKNLNKTEKKKESIDANVLHSRFCSGTVQTLTRGRLRACMRRHQTSSLYGFDSQVFLRNSDGK